MLSNWTRYFHKDQWFSLFFRLALGSVFLIAGAGKLPHGVEFSGIVAGYGLLPEGLSQVYAMLLPWAEIIVGSLLILGILPRITSSISIAIIASFITANIYILASGSADGMCGCFGEVIPLTHTQSLVTNFIMLSISLFLLFRHSIKFNLRSVFSILIRTRAAIALLLVVIMVIMSIPAPALAMKNILVEIPAAKDTSVNTIKVNPDITGDRLEDTVKPTLMYFYNEQCPSCMMQKPVIDTMEEEYGDNIIIERVNSKDNMALLREYNITSVPTMIVVNGGQGDSESPYNKFIGYTEGNILKESLNLPAASSPASQSEDVQKLSLSVAGMSVTQQGDQDRPLPARIAAPEAVETTVSNLVAPTGQTLYWAGGSTFGPNVGIRIDTGTILTTGGCTASGGTDDWFYPYSDIYIVPSGSLSLGGPLVDVGGSYNTVWGASGGIFISQTLAWTSPGGTVGPGTYAVVYDECQNGVLDDIDALFDPAFEVVIPADVPPVPASFGLVKASAAQQGSYYLLMHSGFSSLFDALDYANHALSVPGCVLDPAGCLLKLALDKIKSEIAKALGVSMHGKEETLGYTLNMAKSYLSIAADPPDPDYRELTPLSPIDYVDAQSNDPVYLASADLTNAMMTEGALAEAFLTSIERYQGADESSDGEWALIHARAVRTYADALAYQLALTNTAIASLDAALAADTLPFDDALVTLDDYQARMEASGFTDNETLYLLNLGISQTEIDELSANITAADYSGFSKAFMSDYLADLADANTDAIAGMATFVTDMDGVITALLADPNVFQVRPQADANGPYAVDEGTSLTLDGTGSVDTDGSIAAWDWDLDLDGEFDDASGASPSVAFDHAFNGMVGLQVIDDEGRTGIDYAFIAVSNVNSLPSIDTYAPALSEEELELGKTLVFSVTTSDPDGDTVSVQWTLDGAPVATGSTFSYSPTDMSEIGLRIVQVQVSDASSLGGTVTRTWGVSVPMADADGDGWRANLDCDDDDPDVNPGMTEIIGNGIDDDCDITTGDTPPIADFSFSPTSPLAGENVNFTDESTDSDGSIVSWTWNFGDSATSDLQDPVHSYTSGGSYTVTLTVTDDNGGVESVSQVISVLSPPQGAFTVGKDMNVASLGDGASIVDYSSVYSSSSSYQPENAIDGSTSSSWHTGSGQTTDQWIKVALTGDISHIIDHVIIDSTGGTACIKDFEIRVSNSGTNDTDFITVLTGTVPQESGLHDFDFTPVAAKYVQLYVVDNWGYAGYTLVTHLEVLTQEREGGIVSMLEGLPATIVDYSSQYSSFSPENLLDDSGSYWASAAGQTTGQWVKVELGSGHTYTVERVILDAPYVNYGIRDFEIRVSDTTSDDAAFTTVFTGTALNNTEEQEFAFAPVEARYVQLYIISNYGGDYIREATLKILTPDRSNVAQGSGVGAFIIAQSSQYSSYSGERAIDFSTSTFWQTAEADNQWIKVRLIPGAPHLVDRVKIRSNGNTMSPQLFEIRVSNTTMDDAAFVTVASSIIPQDSMPHWVVFPPVEAKYVQLYVIFNYGSQYLRINDFQVYSPQLGGAVVPFVDLSNDENDNIVSWNWDFGDSATSTEQHPQHTYAAPGNYTVTLTTTDSDGLSDTTDMDYKVLVPPAADFTWSPAVPDEGQTINFTEVSTDADGLVLGWLWQFPHTTAQYTSKSPTATFPDNGDWDVTLTVTDSQLLTVTITQTVTAVNVPPSVDAGSDRTIYWGQDWAAILPEYAILNASVNDRGLADRDSLVVDWDFGDGETAQILNATTLNMRVPHSYDSPGVYIVTANATDKDGGMNTDNATVTVVRRDTIQKVYPTLTSDDGNEIKAATKLWDTYEFKRVLEGRTITFTLGSQVVTAVTDAEGYATAFLTSNEGDIVTASFAGDSYYDSSSATGTVAAAPTLPVGDIIFVIDESGSMGPDIADVKANVADIASQLSASVDYQLGLVGFGAGSGNHWMDIFPGTPQQLNGGAPHIHSPLSDNLSDFDNALDYFIDSGGEEPGFSATVLATSSAMGYFRSECPACVILITDEAATKDISEWAPETKADAVAALEARNAVFFGIINTRTSIADYGVDIGLASVNGGEAWDIMDFREDPEPVFVAILDKCVARIIEESSANLSISKIADPEPVVVDEELTYTIEVTNEGPADAIGVTMTDALSENVTYVSAVPSQGSCAKTAGTIECDLDTIDVGASAIVTVIVIPTVEGTVINSVTVSGERYDPDESNNIATVLSTVIPANEDPVADAGGPYTVDEGSDVVVDASGSYDPDAASGDSIVSYEWDLDDDSEYDDATGVTATTSFSDNGTYTVGLRVTDSFGATGTATASVIVNDLGPTAAFIWNPEPQDEGSAVAFTDMSTSSPDVIISWAWDLAGLDTFTDQNPSYVFIDDGTYTVTLTVTDDDGSTDTISHDINVNDLGPTAILTGDTTLDEDQAGSYDASGSTSSPDAIAGYEWDWDYNGISFNSSGDTSATQTHSWNDDGTYTVAVRVTDDDGSTDIVTIAVSVNHVNVPPVADANGPYWIDTGDDLSLDSTGSYDPDAASGDTIVSYEWDLNDDGSYEYSGSAVTVPWADLAGLPQPGIAIPVGLRVTDSFGADDADTTSLTIYDNNPVAEFSASPNPAAPTQSITFDASTSSHTHPSHSIVLYEWDFDDDSTFDFSSASPVTTFSYPYFGSYTVTLRVTDDNTPAKTDSTSRVIQVNQGNRPPVADANGPYVIDEGSVVTLDASGSSDPDAAYGDTIVSYEWDIDNDGEYDDAVGLTTTPFFNDDGSYTVGLRVTDSFGLSDTDTASVHVNDLGLTAEFTWAPEPQNEGSAVVFTDMSVSSHDDITSWAWDFAGLGTSTDQNPAFTFLDDGIYTVALTVTDDDGSTDTISHDINVNDLGPTTVLTGDTLLDEGQSGSYDASSSTSSPDAIVSYEWDWDYNDTSFIPSGDTGATQSHSWNDDGSYIVAVRVTDDDGSTDTATLAVAVSHANLPPIADANGPYTEDEGNTVNFDDSGSYDTDGTIVDYAWDFGDSNIGTGPTPQHTYLDNGTYTVSLTVTDDVGAIDTTTTTAIINDLGPTAAFSWSPEPQDEGATVDFTNMSTSSPDNIASWAWDFAGLGTSTDQNPSFTFLDDGIYTVTLTVTDEDGSTDTVSHDVTIDDMEPTAVLTGDTILDEAQTGSYDASGSTSSPDAIISYEWDWDYNGVTFNPSVDTGVVQTNSWNNDGIYTVAVRVTDEDGSTDIATLVVSVSHVNEPPIADADGPYWIDEGAIVTFDASGSTDPDTAYEDTIVSYEWDLDDDGEYDDAVGIITTTVYNDDGSYTVGLRVTDSFGLSDTDTASVHVNDLSPTAGFAWSPEPPYADSAVQFIDQSISAPDAIASWEWDFDGQGSASEQNPSFIFTDEGIYNVCLTITDDDGSTDNVCYDLVVIAEADLLVTKTADKETVAGDDTLVYTVIVNNAGPSDAQNVVVTDTLPAGVTFVSTNGCVEDPNGIPGCSLGTIAASGSAQYTITVTVDAGVTGDLINAVSVSSDTTDPTPGNDATSAQTAVTASGRMTGGGNIITTDKVRVTFGFTLHCDTCRGPNNLQVNWGKGNKFHLEHIITASCIDDPSIDPNPPDAAFDTNEGTGIGRYNGVDGAIIEWTFTDAGEPGRNDTVRIVIKDAEDRLVLDVAGNLKGGNNQAHAD